MAGADREFHVRARDAGTHGGHRVVEAGFEAAAVAFVEVWAPEIADGGELAVVVRDIESGREHCFRIDLETGDTAPCG